MKIQPKDIYIKELLWAKYEILKRHKKNYFLIGITPRQYGFSYSQFTLDEYLEFAFSNAASTEVSEISNPVKAFVSMMEHPINISMHGINDKTLHVAYPIAMQNEPNKVMFAPIISHINSDDGVTTFAANADKPYRKEIHQLSEDLAEICGIMYNEYCK